MSAISSVQAGQGLAQFLQSITASSGASGASAASSSTATSAIANTPTTGATKSHHHHGGSAGFEKLLQTVTTALQSAQASGSTADPNQTIESALEKIFKNGITANSAGSTGTTATPASDGDTDAGTATATDTAQQSFLDTLKSFGVTPQQFQQDLATAFKQANGGQLNPGTAFASFSPGSLVDTIA